LCSLCFHNTAFSYWEAPAPERSRVAEHQPLPEIRGHLIAGVCSTLLALLSSRSSEKSEKKRSTERLRREEQSKGQEARAEQKSGAEERSRRAEKERLRREERSKEQEARAEQKSGASGSLEQAPAPLFSAGSERGNPQKVVNVLTCMHRKRWRVVKQASFHAKREAQMGTRESGGGRDRQEAGACVGC